MTIRGPGGFEFLPAGERGETHFVPENSAAGILKRLGGFFSGGYQSN